MRKYRLGDPVEHWKFKLKKYSRYGFYFLLWNFVGYEFYQIMANERRKKYPDFDNWSSTRKVLSFMKGVDEPIKVKHMKGFSVEHEEITTVKDVGKTKEVKESV